jgi:hypothetical protein
MHSHYTTLIQHYTTLGSTPNLDMKVSRSLDPVFRADLCIGEIEILCLSRCRNSGGERTGGGREKYLNCVHIICRLFTLDLKLQNIRILPEETRLVWLYFFVLISMHQGNELFDVHSRGKQCAFMSLSALLYTARNIPFYFFGNQQRAES